MAVSNWNVTVIDGKRYLVIDVAKFRIPLDWDPSSNMFIAVAAPDGAIGNFPALMQGDDGATPDIDNNINFTPLAWNDTTPESASFTETSPGVYKLNLALKRGAPGDPGDTILTPGDYGSTVSAGRLLRVKSDLSGFELVPPPIGGRFLPATLANVPSGNPAYTVCAVPISAQINDYIPRVDGQAVLLGTGADVRADVIARLSTTGVVNGETAGPIVGRGFGATGVNAAGWPTIFSSARPPGSGSSYGKVLAGNTAVVYFRTERQAGGNTYTAVADTMNFEVRLDLVPTT